MEPREYTNMARVEERHFWFVQTRAMVREALLREGIRPNSRLLDVGCGTGGTIRVLKDICTPVGMDMSIQALQYTVKKTGVTAIAADATALPFCDDTFEFAVALDVIEHIPDDLGALREIRRVLRPRGTLVLTVPAHQYLFSTHDRALHHVRRYSRKLLQSRVKAAGFTVSRLTYTNFLLFLPIATVRLAKKILPEQDTMPSSDAVVPWTPVNTGLSGVMALERRWLRRLNLPYGVSLMAVLHA